MTKEDLQKMGIIHLESKLYPNKFFVPQVGEVNLYEPYRWEVTHLLKFLRNGSKFYY